MTVRCKFLTSVLSQTMLILKHVDEEHNLLERVAEDELSTAERAPTTAAFSLEFPWTHQRPIDASRECVLCAIVRNCTSRPAALLTILFMNSNRWTRASAA